MGDENEVAEAEAEGIMSGGDYPRRPYDKWTEGGQEMRRDGMVIRGSGTGVDIPSRDTKNADEGRTYTGPLFDPLEDQEPDPRERLRCSLWICFWVALSMVAGYWIGYLFRPEVMP